MNSRLGTFLPTFDPANPCLDDLHAAEAPQTHSPTLASGTVPDLVFPRYGTLCRVLIKLIPIESHESLRPAA